MTFADALALFRRIRRKCRDYGSEGLQHQLLLLSRSGTIPDRYLERRESDRASRNGQTAGSENERLRCAGPGGRGDETAKPAAPPQANVTRQEPKAW
jgi:hypothetical protein